MAQPRKRKDLFSWAIFLRGAGYGLSVICANMSAFYFDIQGCLWFNRLLKLLKKAPVTNA